MKNDYFYILLILFCFIDSLMDHNNLAIKVLFVGRVIRISSEDGLEIQEINLIEMQRPARGKKPTFFQYSFFGLYFVSYMYVVHIHIYKVKAKKYRLFIGPK